MKNIKSDSQGFGIVELAILLFVLAMVGVLGWIIYSGKKSGADTSKSTNAATSDRVSSQSSTETTSSGQENAARGQDAAGVLAAIANFESINNGHAPQALGTGNSPSTLLICASDCTSNNSQLVKLSHYEARDVLYHPYVSNLTVTNTETVFIINKASCGESDNDLIQAAGGGVTQVAVLYDLIDGSTPKQQCIGM